MKKILVAISLAFPAFATAYATTIAPSTSYSAYVVAGTSYTVTPAYAGDAADSFAEISRIYEVFNLPSYVAGTSITSAFFTIMSSSRFNGANNPLGLYSVTTDQGSSDWLNKPALNTLITSFNPDQSPNNLSFDVTPFINSQYSGDGVASLSIAGLTEGQGKNSWTYFDINSGRLTFAVSEVPEPATVALLGLGLLGFAASRRKSAMRKRT